MPGSGTRPEGAPDGKHSARAHLLDAHLIEARPKALAALLRYFRHLDRAEDALQEASLRALRSWPEAGLPRDPTAWLIRAGRNAGIDALRRDPGRGRGTTDEAELDALPASDDDEEQRRVEALDAAHYKDDMLRLMFMCCQEALPVSDRLALALRVVCGLETAEIARALLLPVATMAQRLTRAKRKAAAIAVRLDTPPPQERLARLEQVSRMIYLLFNEGYAATAGAAHVRPALCQEAIRLARLLVTLFPGQAEQRGLLALCLLQHARHRARIGADGGLVSLEDQDRGLWQRELIAEGSVHLEIALRAGHPGAYQVQAAIAATHGRAARFADTDWAEIVKLYAALERLQPSPVVTLNRAAALARVEGPAAALALIEPLESALAGYLPYLATRAGLLQQSGRPAEAAAFFRLALACSPTDQERRWLEARLAELAQPQAT